MDAGDEGGEAALLLGLGAGDRERAHGAAVEGSEEADDVLAAGVVAGELEGALDRLGAGVAVVELVRAGHGGDGREAVGEDGHVLVVEVGAGHVDEFGGLVLNSLYYFGMTMPGGVDGDAGGEVEELVAVDVGDADAASGFGDHGVAAGVARGDEAVVGGDGLLREGTGEGGLQFGAVLGEFLAAGGLVGGAGLLRQDAHGVSPWLRSSAWRCRSSRSSNGGRPPPPYAEGTVLRWERGLRRLGC